MDASVTSRSTDALGRRSGPRRRYSIAEKRAIVEETQVRGASVPEVAQRHGINTNLVFGWRRLHKQGLLKADAAMQVTPPLLPGNLTGPTVVPGKYPAEKHSRRRQRKQDGAVIEIEFTGGVRLIVRGGVDAVILTRIITALSGQ